jgi:hypothetical protein
VQGLVQFQWGWEGQLGPDEVFDIRVCHGEGCRPQFGKYTTDGTTWVWQPDQGDGIYRWQAVVIRRAEGRVLAERAHSPVWSFNWSGGTTGERDTGKTKPSPKPTR